MKSNPCFKPQPISRNTTRTQIYTTLSRVLHVILPAFLRHTSRTHFAQKNFSFRMDFLGGCIFIPLGNPKPVHLKPRHLKWNSQRTMLSRRHLPCLDGVSLWNCLRKSNEMDMSSANFTAESYFRCPHLRWPLVGLPDSLRLCCKEPGFHLVNQIDACHWLAP